MHHFTQGDGKIGEGKWINTHDHIASYKQTQSHNLSQVSWFPYQFIHSTNTCGVCVPDMSEQSNRSVLSPAHQPDGEAWLPVSKTGSALREWQKSSSKIEELGRAPWGSDI